MKWNSVLCLLLLASNTQAAFWNKNGNKDGDNRRRLTEEPTVSMDVDAATGTVTQTVSAEQEKAIKAAQSCDGQMAQSLVNANEAMMNAKAERDEMMNQKTQALDQIAGLETSLEQMREVNQQLERKVQETIQEKDAKIKSIMDGLESTQGELVTDYENKLTNMANTYADQVAALNSQIESSKESSMARIQELEAKIVQTATAAETALASALKEVEDKYAGEIANLKEQMVAQEKQAADALANQAKAAQATLNAELKAKNQEIKDAIAQAKKAEQDAKESDEELAMWRATHQNRTYCNYTYMTEDIYWASSATYNKSAELTWTAYEGAASLASKATEKTYIALEETKVYTSKGQEIFQKNVKPHYDKHLKPHYDKHVSPVVAKVVKAYEKEILPKLKEIKSQIDPKIEQFKEGYKKQFNKLARKYATACNKAFKAADKLAKKNNLKAFDDYLSPSWKASCENPKDTLQGAQIAVIVALLLPHTFSILRFILWLVLLPLRIFIAITPLRFFFSYKSSSTKKPKKTPTKTVGEVKVKPKKGQKSRINSSQ
ncbi:unnamed protein product [Cylindrotheca closterium]|uniref:Uncharacterized protein n=1 Tax=Cylindrotheca closterium TaxID=2856 RepID=A0AAD2JJK9_9STRA|nr:unnamed protein product [Cylindrotheca closterium]